LHKFFLSEIHADSDHSTTEPSTTKEYSTTAETKRAEEILPPEYSVYSPRCKIPRLNAFEPEVMEIFEKKYYEPCSTKRPLTSIEHNLKHDTVKVFYHSENEADYEFNSTLSCCYEEISRGEFDPDVV
jgi:hypothetical protein